MQATRQPPILLFHLSTPGRAVVSRLKFKSWDRPGRPGPRQATTDQTWQAARVRGGEGGTGVWMLIFYQGSETEWWAGVLGMGQGHMQRSTNTSVGLNLLLNPGTVSGKELRKLYLVLKKS